MSRSRDFDPSTRRHAFGLWVSLRHSIFTAGSMPPWLADAEKETTALSVLFSFQYLLPHFPRDALQRYTALSGHWPFAADSEASDWAAHGFWGWDSGGLTAYFKEEFEAFVFLFVQLSSSSTGSPRRSLRCIPAYWLDFLSYLTTDASNFHGAPDPSRSRGEKAMVAPCCHPWYGTACSVGLIGQPLTGSSLCFSASVVILRVHKVGSLNDHPTRLGDRKKQTHKDGRRGSLRDPLVFFFRYPHRRGFTKRTQTVRRARRQRDGGFPRTFLQGSLPPLGP